MKQDTTECHNLSIGCRDILTDILRQGAQEMLAEAIKNEVAEYIASHAHLCDDEGHRLVVRLRRVSFHVITPQPKPDMGQGSPWASTRIWLRRLG